jgi:multidrug efflux pump subunit AcrA (membrane-fusion protein)
MSEKRRQNNTSAVQKANHLGIALFILVALAGIVLWHTGNLHFGSHDAAEAVSTVDDVHQHGDENSQVTVWDERFEIFLEHPLIEVNESVPFVTHVSDLVTLEPRKSGLVTFILQLGSTAPIKHIETKPARDGIYIPELTFPKPGDWNVSLAIPLDDKDHVISLSPVKVYGSHDELHTALPTGQVDGISFLKEQQWKVPTKTETVQIRQTGDTQSLAVPESAIVDEGQEHVVFVQLAGETFEERPVETGSQVGDYIQILSGLAAGERVVTKGADVVAEAQHAAGGHEHGDEQVVDLTEDEIKRYAIEVGTTGPGQIDVHVRLPGQIMINTDRMAHIMPNASGVVRRVFKNVGEKVKTGEILAWLESSELGKAKVDYLTKWAELGCCSMDLTRAQQISDSTTGLLETLKSSPSLESIREAGSEALDANHTLLVSAYAELVLAKSAYEREKSLYEKKISSEKDYLAAENSYKKADAKYAATRDSIAFNVKRNLLEAQRAQQVRQIELKGAERNLYVLGLSTEDINNIQFYAQGQKPVDSKEEICTDPNCPECAAKRAAQQGQSIAVKASTDDINDVRLVVQEHDHGEGEEEQCNDPNCPDCAAERAAQQGQSIVVKASTDDINDVRIVAQEHDHGEGEEEQCNDPNCSDCAAERAGQQVQPIAVKASAEDINDVRLVAQEHDHGEEEKCNDPNCSCNQCAAERAEQAVTQPLVLEASNQDERLAWYPLRAPFDATVIEKHITLGEKLTGETSAYTVADLSTVWVDLNIYQKDLPFIKAGQSVTVTAGSVAGKVEGKISYVGPIVGEKTRTALARVVLDNTSGALRPGTFVTADVLVDKASAKVVVPKDIIQDINDELTVFVKSDHGFEPRTVTLGRANNVNVEIVSGLRAGEQIVTKNSFRLKAELQKVAAGAHAGHGHAH